MTYGIKKAKVKAVIPGDHATIRTPDSTPVFYFYFEDKAAGLGKGGFGAGSVSNPNQFALVKLDITKSSRETNIGEFGAFGTLNGDRSEGYGYIQVRTSAPGFVQGDRGFSDGDR